MKLSKNSRLVQPLREYQKAEKARRSIYAVVGEAERVRTCVPLSDRVREDRHAGLRNPEVIYVDGRQKVAASTYRVIEPRWQPV